MQKCIAAKAEVFVFRQHSGLFSILYRDEYRFPLMSYLKTEDRKFTNLCEVGTFATHSEVKLNHKRIRKKKRIDWKAAANIKSHLEGPKSSYPQMFPEVTGWEVKDDRDGRTSGLPRCSQGW